MIKKFSILSMLLLAMCSMVLVSCSDDDDNGEQKSLIVGTWVSVETEGKYTTTSTVTFNTDGTFLNVEEVTGESAYKVRGSYIVKGNKLAIVVSEIFDPEDYGDNEWHKVKEERNECTFEVKGDKLYLYSAQGSSVVFVKK